MSDGLTALLVWLLFPAAMIAGILIGRVQLWRERREARRMVERNGSGWATSRPSGD